MLKTILLYKHKDKIPSKVNSNNDCVIAQNHSSKQTSTQSCSPFYLVSSFHASNRLVLVEVEKASDASAADLQVFQLPFVRREDSFSLFFFIALHS